MTDVAIADLHSAGLQAVTQQQQFEAVNMQKAGSVKMQPATMPNATRMKAPAIDKAAIKVRQQ